MGERRSVIRGAIRYFEQVAQSVLLGKRSEGVRHEIERCEVQLLQVQEHIVADIKRLNKEEIPNLKDETMFGSKGMEDAISKCLCSLSEQYRQLSFCIRARACGFQILAAYPGENELKEARQRSIEKALELLGEDGDLLPRTESEMRKKVRSMAAILNRQGTVNERKLNLLKCSDQLVTDVLQDKERIARDLQVVNIITAKQLEPVTIILKVENDQIVASSLA
ncbi:hypothetical protein A3Q32_17735 [Alcanivorax sp. KX64203]|nr:hypothetical protein A3Q32_17735 [Alcanivorax sp. KX64203]